MRGAPKEARVARVRVTVAPPLNPTAPLGRRILAAESGEVLVEVDTVVPCGSVGFGWGTTADGRRIMFAGDWFAMFTLSDALARGERPVVSVPARDIR
jgi:hypothetical protein